MGEELTLQEVVEEWGNRGPSELDIAMVIRRSGVTLWGQFKQATYELEARKHVQGNEGLAGKGPIDPLRRDHRDQEIRYLRGLQEELWAALCVEGPVTKERIAELELREQTARLMRFALIEKGTQGVVGCGSVEALLGLPVEVRQAAVQAVMAISPMLCMSLVASPEFGQIAAAGELIGYVERLIAPTPPRVE